MKSVYAAVAVAMATGVMASAAWADGPRASSGNNWPGMMNSGPSAGAYPIYQYEAAPVAAQPRYEWRENYDAKGKWRGQWVLVP